MTNHRTTRVRNRTCQAAAAATRGGPPTIEVKRPFLRQDGCHDRKMQGSDSCRRMVSLQ